MKTKILLVLLALCSVQTAFAKRANIWPSIPFIRGADLCSFHNAYSQTKQEYMAQMVRNAQELMAYGAYGMEALHMLESFDRLYTKNLALASYQNFGVTLESSLKAFVDGYHRDLHPRVKKISFQHLNSLQSIVTSLRSGLPAGNFNDSMMSELDFIAYGTYSLAPNCRGNLQVTLHLIGRNGMTTSYTGTGHPSTVMSIIASQLYTEFQRTQFPSTLRIGQGELTIIGGLSGSVDEVSDLKMAELACETLDARLPNAIELDLINAYGDWSGGVGLGNAVWALPNGKVFHPGLRNPSPVRNPWEVNQKTYKYYCVR